MFVCRLLHSLLRSTNSSSAIHEWWRAIADFVRSPRMRGHRIVPVGHSAGATAMLVFFLQWVKVLISFL